MKFSINSKVLLSRLVASGKAINSRPAISILGCFLFSLKDNILSITASDADSTVVSRIEVADAESDGMVCIDAKRITELLKSMPDCPVSFMVNGKMEVLLRHPKGKYNLSGFSGSDYPISDAVNPDDIKGSFTIPTTQILSAFDKVGFAIDNNEIRPQLNGIFWDIKPDSITYVASDTRVLAKYRNTQIAPGVETSFILPGRSIPLIRAFINKQSEIKVTTTGKKVIIEGADFKVSSTLLNGNFPNYNRVIPQNQSVIVVVDRNDFYDAINRVSICASTQEPILRFNLSTNHIDAIAEDICYNVGGEESIACEYSGADMNIGFSSSYLKGLVNALDTQKMVIKLETPERPGVFVPSENDEYGELTLLCMPVNIASAN